MDRNTALWTMIAFFGATVAFGLVRGVSDDLSRGAAFGLQVAVLVVIVGAIWGVSRWRGRA